MLATRGEGVTDTAMPQALVVLTTCANREDAERLAAGLVEQRLAGCVSIVADVTSIYRWQGQIERERESLLVIKTTESAYAAVEQAIRARSSYAVPEVLAIRASRGADSYLDWLSAAVAGHEE
jgi:periplasmic divalent cation tolerance protein